MGKVVSEEIRDQPERWVKISERRSEPSWLGSFLDFFGLLGYVPELHRQRLMTPEANVAVYRKAS